MRKIIFNWKYLVFFGLITLFLVYSSIEIPLKYSINQKTKLDKLTIQEIENNKEIPEEDKKEEIKNKQNSFIEYTWNNIKKFLSFNSLYSTFLNIKIRVIPLLLIATIFIFERLKVNLIKYNIGRNQEYRNELFKSKLKIALIPIGYITIYFIIMWIISVLSGDFEGYKLSNLLPFAPDDFLGIIAVNDKISLLISFILVLMSTYILNLFILEVLDRIGKINTILFIGIVLWMIPIVLMQGIGLGKALTEILPSKLLDFDAKFSLKLIDWFLPALVTVITTFWISKLDREYEEIINE